MLTTKMPPSVSSSIATRKYHLPLSPASVPPSIACSKLKSSWWMNPGRWPLLSLGANWPRMTIRLKIRISVADTAASHPMSADGPRAIVLSKA